MGRKYVFADEAGNFDFKPPRPGGPSRYFILTTITMTDCTIGNEMLTLRRDLAHEGLPLGAHFHATEEAQEVRDRVYTLLARHDFRVDATIFEKPKTQPHLQADQIRFYKTIWFNHMKYVGPKTFLPDDELLVVGASVGTKRKRQAFIDAIDDVIGQISPTTTFQTAFWSAGSDPCLQIADYCSWAIQRKWEGNDSRSYDLIQDKIRTEFDCFKYGTILYY